MVNLDYIRESKKLCIEKITNKIEDKTGRLNIKEYTDVCLSPLGSCPYITPQANLIIDDCDYTAEIQPQSKVSQKNIIEGTTLYGGFFRREWGHFLLNTAARLWPIFNGLIDLDSIDRIVFFIPDNRAVKLKGNFMEFFRLAGIRDKIVFLNDTTVFEKLYVPDIAFEFGSFYSNEFNEIFNTIKLAALREKAFYNADSKILLSRAHLKSCQGQQINIELFDNLFASNGFNIIYPEEITLTELICRMHSAKCICSYSGTTAHNLLFASPQTSVVILERSAATNIPQLGIFLSREYSDITLIDASFHPLITSSTNPLSIYGMTEYMQKYISNNNIIIPDGWLDRFNPKKELRRYIKYHRHFYGYGMGFNQWESSQYNTIVDAYFDSLPRYDKWLKCRAPFRFSDFFSPRIMFRYLRGLRSKSHK